MTRLVPTVSVKPGLRTATKPLALAVVLVVACHTPVVPKPAAPKATPAATTVRFDEQVREDFFAGLRGDAVALERAMKLCEDVLANQPKHPEAMVWHGAGLVGRASLAFRAGDSARGIELYGKGIAEMDAAVALAPDRIGVRIPRGAVVLAMAPFAPAPEKTKLYEKGVADYEVTLAKQETQFKTLTLHAREQLLYGLTDAYASLGDRAKAETYYRRMTVDAAGSELLPRAEQRAKGQAVAGPTPCEECHGEARGRLAADGFSH